MVKRNLEVVYGTVADRRTALTRRYRAFDHLLILTVYDYHYLMIWLRIPLTSSAPSRLAQLCGNWTRITTIFVTYSSEQ